MHTFTRLLASLLMTSALYFSMPLQAGPVDINTADAATLAGAMNGVGERKAETIVAYRETHGPFMHIDELAKVKGIGSSTIDKNRENLSVGSVAAP